MTKSVKDKSLGSFGEDSNSNASEGVVKKCTVVNNDKECSDGMAANDGAAENLTVSGGEEIKITDRKISGMRLYICMLALVLANFIVSLDVFIVNTIIDVVSKSLGGYAVSGWLITGYTLPNSLLSLLWGRTASILGYQESMMYSILIFEVGSVVSATATSMGNLIVGRVCAGIGGSGLQTLSLIIGSSLVEERNRPMVVSIVMSSFAIASVIGPFVGGAFTTHVTWRWCFWISLPVGGSAALLFFLAYNPERLSFPARITRSVKKTNGFSLKRFKHRETYNAMCESLFFRFDIVGFFLSCSGVCLFLLGLTFGGEHNSWKRALVICFLIIGFLLFVSSIVYDFYIFDRINPGPFNPTYRPLMVKGVVNNPSVLIANGVTCCSMVAFSGYILYSVQFYQLVLGYSAWNAGLHLIPLVISSIFSAIFCGVLTKKTGHVKYVMIVNMALILIGGGVVTLLDNYSNNSMLIGVWILPGFGLGAALQCGLISSQLQMTKDSPDTEKELIEITAFNNFTKSLGSSIGGILSTTVFISYLWKRMNDVKLAGFYGKKINELIKYRLQYFDGRSTEAADIFSSAATEVWWMCFGFAAVGFICACLSSSKKVQMEQKVEKSEADEPSLPEPNHVTAV